MIKETISGLFFGVAVLFTLWAAGVSFDKLEFTSHKSFEGEYEACQQKLSYFEQQKQVVCEAKQPPIILPMFSGFVAGGFSVAWLILFGYPLIKERLEKRKGKE